MLADPWGRRRVLHLVAVVVLMAWPRAASAEPDARVIRGTVSDRSGSPVPGALVTCGDSSATTDERGRFELAVAPGARDLVILADDFETRLLRIEGELDQIDVELSSLEAGTGEVIEIQGRAPPSPDPVSYELGPELIRKVPGAGNDALRSLQTLPGVARVPFGMGGLILRGTSPRDSRVYLDGIEVPLLYHFGGLSSFYPSAALASMTLLPGGYSSEYGRGQGGIVVLESRPGRRDRVRVGAETSMIDVSARAEGPAGEGGSWSLAMRRSVLEAILPALQRDDEITTTPRYLDAQLRYDHRLWSGAEVTLHAFGSDDQIGFLYGERKDRSFAYTTRFVRLGLRFEQTWETSSLVVAPWLGLDDFVLESASQAMRSEGTPWGGRSRYRRDVAWGALEAGTDVSAGGFAVGSTTETDTNLIAFEREGATVDAALWSQAVWSPADGDTTITPGLRLDYFGLSGELTLDPRLEVTHTLAEGYTLRGAAGVYHQAPSVADSVWGNDALESSYAIQSSAGGEIALSDEVTIGATGYYTALRDLAVDDPNEPAPALDILRASKLGALESSREFVARQFGSFTTLQNAGSGRSLGIELMVRYLGARGFAWASYTLSSSRRQNGLVDDASSYRHQLDQPHLVTLVGSLRLGSWQLGSRFRYASGNPVTPILGGMPVGDDEYAPVYGAKNSDRLADFVQLDLRVDRVWVRDWGSISAFLDVQNVTRQANVEGRLYEDDFSSYETTTGLPIFPALGISYAPPPPAEP